MRGIDIRPGVLIAHHYYSGLLRQFIGNLQRYGDHMNCKFVNHESPDATGKRRLRCLRRGCGWITPPIATPIHRIHATCKGWPLGWELGHWCAIFLAAAGITKGRWSWLRGKLGYKTPCECGEREEQYNGLGAMFARWLVSVRQ